MDGATSAPKYVVLTPNLSCDYPEIVCDKTSDRLPQYGWYTSEKEQSLDPDTAEATFQELQQPLSQNDFLSFVHFL